MWLHGRPCLVLAEFKVMWRWQNMLPDKFLNWSLKMLQVMCCYQTSMLLLPTNISVRMMLIERQEAWRNSQVTPVLNWTYCTIHVEGPWTCRWEVPSCAYALGRAKAWGSMRRRLGMRKASLSEELWTWHLWLSLGPLLELITTSLLGDIKRMMAMPEPKHLLKCSSPKPLPKTQAQAQVQAQAQAAAVHVHVHMQQHQQASWHSSPAGTEKWWVQTIITWYCRPTSHMAVEKFSNKNYFAAARSFTSPAWPRAWATTGIAEGIDSGFNSQQQDGGQ